MSIRRPAFAFESHFTQVPNQWVRDARLSRRARGLLVELMSHSVGWETTIEHLVRAGTEKRDAIRSAIAELEQHGYLEREQGRQTHGRFGNVAYVLSDPWESPLSDFPTSVKPPTKNTISQEDQTITTDQDSQRQSKPIAPRDRTDSKMSPVMMGVARRAGLSEMDLYAISDSVEAWCTRYLGPADALAVALWIIDKAKDHPRAPKQYVQAAIGKTPLEVQQYIDQTGLGTGA